MCGIAGYYAPNQTLGLDVLRRMADTIRHRGPDDEGYEVFCGGSIGLAHRRLAIIDLSPLGHQPMYDDDRRACIVFNGELYNFRQLRSDLERLGHTFTSKSDTEVLLKSYLQYGEKCLERLDGEFSFCIYDPKDKSLFLARDRFGVKPLYYSSEPGRFIFASEMKALLQFPRFSTTINRQSIANFLAFGVIPSPDTILNEVQKLRAGCCMRVTNGNVSIRRYWSPQFKEIDATEDTCFDQLRQMMADSVKERLVSDVPIGTFLSGGVDSSLVSYYASCIKTDLNTFSIGFHDPAKDESRYAQMVADRIGSSHHRYYCDQEMLLDLNRICWHFDEPFSDFSALPTFALARETKKEVTVCLSGDGCDELFCGYTYHIWLHLFKKLAFVPPSVAALVSLPLRAASAGKSDSSTVAQVYRLMKYLAKGERQFILDRYLKFNATDIGSFLGDSAFEHGESIVERFFDTAAGNKFDRFDLKFGLEDDMLVKVDRMAMAHSLEVRVPFLDHELSSFMMSIPSQLKLRGKETKYLMKKVAAEAVGPEPIYRHKQGFSVPLDKWLTGSFGGLLEQHVLSNNSSLGEILDISAVRKFLLKQQPNWKNLTMQAYQFIVLDLWLKNYKTNKLAEPLI